MSQLDDVKAEFVRSRGFINGALTQARKAEAEIDKLTANGDLVYVKKLTQAEYNALPTPSASTLYVVTK
jgi:hypothetical protein